MLFDTIFFSFTTRKSKLKDVHGLREVSGYYHHPRDSSEYLEQSQSPKIDFLPKRLCMTRWWPLPLGLRQMATPLCHDRALVYFLWSTSLNTLGSCLAALCPNHEQISIRFGFRADSFNWGTCVTKWRSEFRPDLLWAILSKAVSRKNYT